MLQRESSAAVSPAWAEELVLRLEEQRENLRAALEGQHHSSDQWAEALQSQLASIEGALTAVLTESQDCELAVSAKLALIKAEEGRLTAHNADLLRLRTELDASRRSLESVQQVHLSRQQRLLDDLAAQLAGLQRQETAIRQRETALDHREGELELERQRTRSQRSTIARELKARRKENQEAYVFPRVENSLSTKLNDPASGPQLVAARLEISKLRAAEEGYVHQQLSLEDQLHVVEREVAALREQLASAGRQTADANHSGEVEELKKRLEMALADVRDLKLRNATLSEQASKSKWSGGPSIAAGGDMNWEARKEQLLAQLQSDFGDDDVQAQEAKLTIQMTIEQTDRVVAAKNEEIAELRRLLAEQSGNIGSVAIGAAAIAEMLDSDELVRQERDNLRQLQEKLREQIKSTEIDLSVERAKIARERALLDEKLREYEGQLSQRATAPAETASKTKTGANRGRWFQRLGLREEEKPAS